jgi:hypothetical protein
MTRRLLLALAVVALAACGRETVTTGTPSEVPGTGASGSAAPGTGAPAANGIAHPTGADEAVVRLTLGGGFVPEGADFQRPPDLLVLGDGTVIRPGVQTEIFPGPMLPALTVAKLDEAGLQAVLGAADEAGLLAEPPAYDIPAGADQITDAPGTTLELHANGQGRTHTAYALGLGQDPTTESTPARQKLNDFVTQLHDLSSLVGDHLTAEEPYAPARFGVIARPATPEELAPPEDGPAPVAVAWPAGAGSLADSAGACFEPPPAAVQDAFQQGNQLTRFTESGVTYVAFVRALLPDESCAQFA